MASLIAFRIPPGWIVKHNEFYAQDEIFSEDLLWLEQDSDDSQANKYSVDLGWYQNRFRAVVLLGGWDNVVAEFSSTSVKEICDCVESWLSQISQTGGIVK